MSVKLIWGTPNVEEIIMYCARVSNPQQQDCGNPGLLGYCLKNAHWSPFEMATFCVEINTTRDIGRQILRHRSFSFQEFSQRYAEVTDDNLVLRQTRTQDRKRRQCSHETNDPGLVKEWNDLQREVFEVSRKCYKRALSLDIAKEQARSILPEGITPTRMYMSGSVRSWIHYLELRTGNGTQKEHQEIAKMIQQLLIPLVPNIAEALGWKLNEEQKVVIDVPKEAFDVPNEALGTHMLATMPDPPTEAAITAYVGVETPNLGVVLCE